MKKIILILGICTAVTAFAQQNQSDSIHIVVHESKNGVERVLDTIVLASQQQSLMLWMKANGWDAPPPPPPPPAPGAPLPPGPPPAPGAPRMFEQEIIIEGDSGMDGEHRMVFVSMDGDSTMPANGQRMIFINTNGDSMLPPMPPMPPGECRRMIVVGDVEQMPPNGDGNVMIMRHPMPPMPGSDVTVDVTEKDTVINGETRKMIIKTERIILPKNPPAPPMPPAKSKTSAPSDTKRDLVAYPNPTNGVISVEFDIAPKEKTSLRILDMNGKIVYSEDIVDEQGKHIYREINLSGKGKGTYTVEVKSAKKVIAEKIILQ